MKLKWALLGALALALLAADWLAGGIGPRLIFGTATLVVATTPPGADITVNGAAAGTTPATLENVRPGATVLAIEHPYHPPALRRLTLQRGERRSVEVVLKPAFGALAIATNPRGAQVSLNGETLAQKTPVTVENIRAGRHEVEVFIYGRAKGAASVEVLPDALAERTFELERVPMGRLSVQASPAKAALTLLDAPVSYRPGVELPTGAYRLRAQAEGYASREFDVVVKPGRNLASVNLERLHGRLKVNLQPASAAVRIAYRDDGGPLNVAYEPNMRIPAGPFSLHAVATGYRNLSRNLAMRPAGLSLNLSMQPFNVTPGRRFRDALKSGGEGPQLVVVGAGAFRMGAAGGAASEGPARQVQVTEPFAMGAYEVTNGEFSRYEAWRGAADEPVTNIALRDVAGYLAFLSRETGYRYRLPSEAEWEYAARAGSQTRFAFGDDISALCRHANVRDATMKQRFRQYDAVACADGFVRLAPVGSFLANAFGLHDMLGNAEEWVQDCWHSSYAGAPAIARAWVSRCEAARVVRGGAFDSPPSDLRIAYRSTGSDPADSLGFRVVREL